MQTYEMQNGLMESEKEKKALKRTPLTCHFDLTYHCNLQCIHCYVEKEDRPELKTGEIKNILDQIAAAGVLYLNFSGGEVFTRKDFFEIANYARKLHFALIITTNGTLIDEKIADQIAKLHPLKVKISLYSTHPQTHDDITLLPGSFEKSLNAIKLLKNRNISVEVTHIIMKGNFKDFNSFYELTQQLDVDFKVDYQIIPKLDGNRDNLKFQIDEEKAYDLLTNPILIKKYEPQLVDFHKKSFYDDIFCDAGIISFYITPYGDVYPCIQFPILCGNLKKDSFEEIWYKSPEMLEAASLRTYNLVCADCDLRKYCNFCPGVAYTESGDMLSPYERCCTQASIFRKIRVQK